MNDDERRPMVAKPPPGLTPWDETRQWSCLGTRDSRYVVWQRGERFNLKFNRWEDHGGWGPTKYLGRDFTSLAEAQQAAADHDKEEW